jgi:putative nucleotidyltransferase with HDIG domain
MISRQIARDMCSNFELAFMCGLLHDIGKTIMLDLIHEYMLSPELRTKIIEENHAEIGRLLAIKWNFGEDIQECIRFHHVPDKATINRNMVEIVYLANIMTHTSDQPGSAGEIFLSMAQINRQSDVSLGSIDMPQVSAVNNLMDQIESLDKDAWEIVC